MADIFISYCREDSARSQAVCSLLERRGYSVAIDREFLQPGDGFRSVIDQQLRSAKVVIVLWSARAVQKTFVKDEASRAMRHSVLLQLIIDDMSDELVPLGFGELQRLRCEWDGRGGLADRSGAALLSALRKYLPAVEPIEAALKQLQHEVDTKLGSEYDVLEQIGTGRMSVVFRARHRVAGMVALKATPLAGILLLPGFYAEFKHGIEAARQLSHRNILSIRDVKMLDTVACTVMDLVDGVPLSKYMVAAGQLPLGRIKDIATDIAEALAHAHSNEVVHGSLSPNNILIANDGDRAVVSDFGMPEVGAGPEATVAKALFMDARYMSPEQCVGDAATPYSDHYALGAIAYEMLTGSPPFAGKSSFVIMRQHCEAAPRPIVEFRPECPPAVIDSVMHMLAKKPKERKERYLVTTTLAQEIARWPLAEPVRPSAPGAPAVAHSANVALQSYTRCLCTTDFVPSFYQRLLRDDTLAPHLENVNFNPLVEHLNRAIRHLLEYAQGQQGVAREIDNVALRHKGFGLTESQIRRFVAALITLATERDPGPQNSNEREQLSEHWRTAIEVGLLRFIALAQQPVPRVSGVIPLELKRA